MELAKQITMFTHKMYHTRYLSLHDKNKLISYFIFWNYNFFIIISNKFYLITEFKNKWIQSILYVSIRKKFKSQIIPINDIRFILELRSIQRNNFIIF